MKALLLFAVSAFLSTPLAATTVIKPLFDMVHIQCNVENVLHPSVGYSGLFYPYHTHIGYLEKLSINGVEIQADTSVYNPKSPDTKKNVVAILAAINWNGNPEEAIALEGKFSPIARASVLEALYSSQDKPIIKAEWIVYDYDHQAQKYFPFFHTNGKQLNLTLADKWPSYISSRVDTEIKNPTNYDFYFYLTPPQGHEEQLLSIAFKSEGKTFSLPIVSGISND